RSRPSLVPHSVRFLLLSCYCPHRDLHSFPTRRSSDLPVLYETADSRAQTRWHRLHSAKHVHPSHPICTQSSKGSLCQVTDAKWRSEEHTSELQSRENLVCRLLLEKKKTRKPRRQRSWH